MFYTHTQINYRNIFVLIAAIILLGFLLIIAPFNLVVFLLMVLVILILAFFVSLKVTVDDKYIRIKFGFGLFRKRFDLDQIVSARAVKNIWYYGGGIKIRLNPYMVIYNISGFDAVEIKMKNNKIYRIGTDEPKKLEQAILKVIRKK